MIGDRRGVPLLLCAVVLALFAPFFLLGKVFVPGDFQNFIYPWRAVASDVSVHNLEQFDTAALFYPLSIFINERLKVGDLPLWDPTVFCGYPVLASGYSALLYPPRIVAHWMFSPPVAVTVLLMLHVAAMGLGMYGWLAHRGLSPKAAGVGGLCWMMSGSSATWLELDLSFMTVYLPLMLWSFDLRRWGLLAVLGALCLHGGHLQMAFYLGWIMIFYALQQAWVKREWRLLLPFILSGAGVVLMAAPTILPFLELLLNSQRPSFNAAVLKDYSTSLPGFLATLVNPDALGNPTRGFMLNRTAGNYPFCEFADYIGLIPLAFAILATARAKATSWQPHEIYSWAALAVLALLFAANTPLYRLLLLAVPVLQRAVPGRFIIVLVFAGCVLAAHGFDSWTRDQSSRRQVAWGVCAISASVALALAGLAWWLKATPSAAKAWLSTHLQSGQVKIPPTVPGPAMIDAWVAGLSSNYLLNPQMAMTVLAGLVLLLTVRRPRPAMLACFIALDLSIFMSHYNTVIEKDKLLPSAPSIAFLQRQEGLFRVEKHGAALFNTLVPYGLNLVTGYGSVLPRRFVETVGTSQKHRSVLMRSVDLTQFDSPILSALNLRFLMQAPLQLQPPQGWEKVYDEEVRIFRNPRALPRVYVRGKVKAFRRFEEALWYLGGPDFNPAEEVVLEQLPPGPLGADAAQAQSAVRLYEPDRVVISSTLPAPGILVLADTFYPGWICRDASGVERPIFPVNGCSRGVYLEAGLHDLDFRFEPRSYWLGLKLCLFGLLGASLTSLWQSRGRLNRALAGGPPRGGAKPGQHIEPA